MKQAAGREGSREAAGWGGWLAASAVFLVLLGAYVSVWEPAHDEGVTFTQAFGPVELEGCDAGGEPAELATAKLQLEQGYGSRGVVDALMADGMHPPAYYLGLRSLATVVGTEPGWLAGLLGVLGILSLLFMGRIASRMAPGPHSALAAMLLLALSPWFVGYSVLLRPYALALCLALAGTWAVLEIGNGKVSAQRRYAWCFGFVLVSSLGLYTLYHYAFVLAWQLLALFLWAWEREHRKQALLIWAALAAGIVLLFAPWLPRLGVHLGASVSGPYYFMGWPVAGEWLSGLGHLFFVFALGEGLWSTSAQTLRIVAAVIGLLTLPWAILSFRKRSFSALSSISKVLWLAFPAVPALVLASDWVRETHTIFLSKTNFVFLPVGILLLVRSAYAFPSVRFAQAVLVSWMVFFAAGLGSALNTRSHALAPMEVVSATIKRDDSSSHLVLLSSDARGYVVPFLLALRQADIREVIIARMPPDSIRSCLAGALRNHDLGRVTLVDFDVPYRPEETLGPPRLRDIAESAESAGWNVVRLQPSLGRVSSSAALDRWWTANVLAAPSGARLLLISTPTRAKYFSE